MQGIKPTESIIIIAVYTVITLNNRQLKRDIHAALRLGYRS